MAESEAGGLQGGDARGADFAETCEVGDTCAGNDSSVTQEKGTGVEECGPRASTLEEEAVDANVAAEGVSASRGTCSGTPVDSRALSPVPKRGLLESPSLAQVAFGTFRGPDAALVAVAATLPARGTQRRRRGRCCSRGSDPRSSGESAKRSRRIPPVSSERADSTQPVPRVCESARPEVPRAVRGGGVRVEAAGAAGEGVTRANPTEVVDGACARSCEDL